MGPPRFELEFLAPKATRNQDIISVDYCKVDEFITFRRVEGLSDKWLYLIRYFITDYLNQNEWKISKKNTLEYLSKIQRRYSITSFRKRTYQIRKLLTYLKIDWAIDINPPPEPYYLPKRITTEDINETLSYFKGNKFFKQINAIILLGISSGMRAEELYQLNIEDMDIENRVLHINHNPNNGQSTKTKISRISFFNEVAKQALIDYLDYYKSSDLKCLFSQSHITRLFRDAPIKVKDLRKAFSQEWTKRNGSSGVKKILMGHSLRNDVDLCHYNAQSPDDLKKIYDKVMGGQCSNTILKENSYSRY